MKVLCSSKPNKIGTKAWNTTSLFRSLSTGAPWNGNLVLHERSLLGLQFRYIVTHVEDFLPTCLLREIDNITFTITHNLTERTGKYQRPPYSSWLIMKIVFLLIGSFAKDSTFRQIYIDNLMHDCNISSALTKEILESCTRPSISMAVGLPNLYSGQYVSLLRMYMYIHICISLYQLISIIQIFKLFYFDWSKSFYTASSTWIYIPFYGWNCIPFDPMLYSTRCWINL